MEMWRLGKFEDRLCVIDEYDQSLTYSEMADKNRELVCHVEGRTLVFVMCSNTIGSILGYTAFINGRVVPVLLNAHLDREMLNTLLLTYLPSYIWLPDDMCEEFGGLERKYSTNGYSLLKTNYEMTYPLYDELALLLTTSGSTGSPKFVRQSYDNIKSNMESIVNYLDLDCDERPITTMPMNYTYGLSIINTHLAVGATILVTDKGLMQKEFWEFFKREQATSFGGVPYTYEMLDRLRFTRMDLPNLHTMTQAGGKITPELHEKFAKYALDNGKKFVVMYGQCEATARMGYLPPQKALEKCGSMGIAIPGGRFKLIDENGVEIKEPKVTGELVYQGQNVTMGYAECGDDLIKGDERGGVLETGDMAQYDEDGYYYIVGRKKRFLKIYGNRVNLDEIDRMVKGQFSELDVASGGVDDHMYVFINDENKVDDVKTLLVNKTGLNHVAFKVKYIPDIPKNDSGKVLYKELEKYYKEEL